MDINKNITIVIVTYQTERKIQWVRDLETLGDFPNKISQTISRTLPIGDFFG